MALDKSKLAKMLARTASDHDGEVLAAMRLANEMLKSADTTWEALLSPKQDVKIFIDMTPKPGAFSTDDVPHHLRNPVVIDAMFKKVYEVQRDGSDFWKWLDSIKRQFDEHGSLTQPQFDGLRRSYSRVMRRS